MRRLMRSPISATTLSLIALIAVSAASFGQPPNRAQPSPARQPGVPQPGSGSPLNAAFEPLTVSDAVYSYFILAVNQDGTLMVDTPGAPHSLELWPIAIPAATHPAGANARRYLGSLVGRKVQFSFREHTDRGAEPAARPPSARAYSEIGATLVQRGLARYCPEPGIALRHLQELQQQASERRAGLWGVAPVFACPD